MQQDNIKYVTPDPSGTSVSMTSIPSGQEPSAITENELANRIDDMLAGRKAIVEKIKPLLIEQVDIYTLPGMAKPSLGKPGAEKLARIFGFSASFKVDEETAKMIGPAPEGKQYVAYVCNLSDKYGHHVGQGRGAAFLEWERTQYKNMNEKAFEAVKETLKATDWKEAQGQYGKYYRVKDGTTFDPLALNKAIKMAQKSAFVDAVIRASGMSDLFTQDIEQTIAVDEDTNPQKV